MPENDIYIFSPSLDETSTYNDLSAGDSIKLFSVYIDNITNCGQQLESFRMVLTLESWNQVWVS